MPVSYSTYSDGCFFLCPLVILMDVSFHVLSINGFQNNDIWIHFVNENLNSGFQISKIMFITENSGFGSFNISHKKLPESFLFPYLIKWLFFIITWNWENVHQKAYNILNDWDSDLKKSWKSKENMNKEQKTEINFALVFY